MGQQSDDLRPEYTRILCAAAVDYLDSTQAVDGAAHIRISCAAVAAIHTSILSKAVIDDSARGTLFLNKLKTVSVSDEYANEDVKNLFAAAAHVGSALLLKDLLDKGVKIDAESRFFRKALRGAAFGGHREVVLLLLDRGANANANANGAPCICTWSLAVRPPRSTALQAAALVSHGHIVRLLL